jgi:hypothetical protein
MRAAKQESGEPFLILCRWCTATNTWFDTDVRPGCVGDCETAATERGIYRVAVVCGGRRIHLEPFAVIASHPGDDD